MAVYPAVTCSHCEKKFKPKTDVAGKKIKCPFCKEVISVPAADDEDEPKRAKSGKAKGNGKAKAEAAPVVEAAPEVPAAPAALAAAIAAGAPPASEFDADGNPYAVVSQDLRRLCPNCAKEMSSGNAIICLNCGYNTLTREAGQTETVLGLTMQQRVLHLLPAAGAAVFMFFLLIFQIFFAVVSPVLFQGTMFAFTDGEWARMWSTLLFLTWFWAGGQFCFKKFIEKPQPDEIKTS